LALVRAGTSTHRRTFASAGVGGKGDSSMGLAQHRQTPTGRVRTVRSLHRRTVAHTQLVLTRSLSKPSHSHTYPGSCEVSGLELTSRAHLCRNFSLLESVAFDTGYAGSNGLEPQSWVNGNGTSYIYFGSGEFDGQGSGHDFSGTLYMPPSGYVNSCDGGRSHTYCDYRQQ